MAGEQFPLSESDKPILPDFDIDEVRFGMSDPKGSVPAENGRTSNIDKLHGKSVEDDNFMEIGELPHDNL